MSIEKDLQRIADKSVILKYIGELEDDENAIVLGYGPRGWRYWTVDTSHNTTTALVGYLERVKHDLLRKAFNVEDADEAGH